ncbi:hypothetical protein IAT38_006024 [Cryptococcus sp. DSM 104549]
MGNTPSHQHGAAHSHHGSPNIRQPQPGSSSPSTSIHTQPHSHSHNQRHPSLRLPMPARHISPQSSNPTSPSGRGGSPRRRKSLELPDLNKLSFTPAALTPSVGAPTTHIHTSHHLAGGPGAAVTSPPLTPTSSNAPAPAGGAAGPAGNGPITPGGRRWKETLGGRSSPLANANALGAMSRLDPSSRATPVSIPTGQHANVNPYFPSTAAAEEGQRAAASRAVPIPIPGSQSVRPQGIEPPPNTVAPTPPRGGWDTAAAGAGDSGAVAGPGAGPGEVQDGMVNVPITWTGGGKVVSVTGNFADNWKTHIPLQRSAHDLNTFSTVVRLPPGQYRIKFVVDDSWRCSKQISTATDDDGTLVNWIEVEAPKTEEEIKAEWAMDSKPAVKQEDNDESQWTNDIPPALTFYQYIEELPHSLPPDELNAFLKSTPYIPHVPAPPTLPRILDKVIVNNDSKRLWDSHDPAAALQTGYQGAHPAGLDDNSILAVPNHVVLNHLTASAIRNGTLGVGTTTRYRKKYITTMFFKPTLADMPGSEQPPAPQPVQ